MAGMFSTDLTAKEAVLGFQRVWIENERNRFGSDAFGEPHILEAVVYVVSESKRIFKTVPPSSRWVKPGVVYKEMGYGRSGISEHGYPRWCPMRVADCDDPELAIRAAHEIPPDVTLVLAVPPIVEGERGSRRILFEASQIHPSRIETLGGEAVMRDGVKRVSFAVIE